MTKTQKINLKRTLFENNEPIQSVLKSETGYVAFQECTYEPAIDYYLFNSNKDQVDGGLFSYEQGATYEEFILELNSLYPEIQFDENSVLLLDEEEIEDIWDWIS